VRVIVSGRPPTRRAIATAIVAEQFLAGIGAAMPPSSGAASCLAIDVTYLIVW
jgi:hypothetical protein